MSSRLGNPTIGYLDLSARYALDLGLHVVVEGVFYTRIYGAMLTQQLAHPRGLTRCYRYEASFDETAALAGPTIRQPS